MFQRLLLLFFLGTSCIHQSKSKCSRKPRIVTPIYKCPTNWTLQFGRCYLYQSLGSDRATSESFCQSQNAYIMIIRNSNEYNYLAQLCLYSRCGINLGATAIAPFEFKWNDGNILSRNSSLWDSNEPNNGGVTSFIKEGCLQAWIENKFVFMFDIYCDNPADVICEKLADQI